MKIEINAPTNPANGMEVYFEVNKRLRKPKPFMFDHQWDESDLSNILTEKQMKEFENGKFEFNVPTWMIRLIQGQKVAKDNTELKFLMQFD